MTTQHRYLKSRCSSSRFMRPWVESLESRLVPAAPVAIDDPTIVNVAVSLANGTAIRSQGGFSVDNTIDGSAGTGWANNGQDDNAAVFETVSDFNPTGVGQLLTFRLNSGGFGIHTLGKFRFSVTTDNRSQFADGLDNGGDVTANWMVLRPITATATAATLNINPDGTIRASGGIQEFEDYVIQAFTNVQNITGFRLEALEDPSFPANGPGRASNGNFVVYSFTIEAANIAGFATPNNAVLPSVPVLTNDSDPDLGDTFSITAVNTAGTQGQVTINAGNTTLRYDPTGSPALQALGPGQVVFDTFTYTITDSTSATDTATVRIVVFNDNLFPVAQDDLPPVLTSVTLANGTAFFSQGGFSVDNAIDANLGSGWANDPNPVGNTAAFETVADLNPSGGPVLLTFRLRSGNFGTHTLGNFRLSATTDNRSLFADGLDNGGDVTASWVQLTPFAATATTSTLTIRPDNTILSSGVIPEVDDYVIQVFTSLQNITGFRLEALEDPSLPVNGPGHGPNGNYVVFNFTVDLTTIPLQTDEDTPLVIPVLANDSDPNPADVLTIDSVNSAGAEGTVTINPDDTLSYDPTTSATLQALQPGESAIVTFTYTVNDGRGGTDTATVTIQVNGLREPPIVSGVPATATIPELNLFAFTASAVSGDTPALPITFSLVGAPAGAGITAGGDFTWTPSLTDGPGVFNFFVRASETGGVSIDVPIEITVLDREPPDVSGVPATATIPELNLFAFTASAVSGEPPALPITFSLVGGVPAGAAITAGGDFTWTPLLTDGPGVFSFFVRASETGGVSIDVPIEITVLDRVPPVVSGVPATVTIPELVPFAFTASAVSGELPALPITFSLVGAPAGAAITTGGNFTWTPSVTDGPGVFSFFVRASETGGVSIDVPIEITVLDSLPIVAVGPNAGGGQVSVFDTAGTPLFSFSPYGAVKGGVRVAVGDVNGDGQVDIITGRGKGQALIKVFDGATGLAIPGLPDGFLAYGPGFKRGVFVAAGDVFNNDGIAEIIVAPNLGKGEVKVFDATGTQLLAFFPYGRNFTGGVRLAAGNVAGGPEDEIITLRGSPPPKPVVSPGPVLPGPSAPVVSSVVRIFDNTGAQLGSFKASGSANNFVTVGNLDGGGFEEIIVGLGGKVRVFDSTGAPVGNTLTPFAGYRGKVRVAAVDVDSDGDDDIVAGTAGGHNSEVRLIDGIALTQLDSFFAFAASFRKGIHVGAG